MTAEPAMQPCPHCGSIATVTAYDTVSYMVRCGFCFASGPHKRDKAEAVAAWNTRAKDTSHAE